MTQRTRVKICGITRSEDARTAALNGVDSIGLNFHAPSPRFIGLDTAIAIRDELPPFVTLTALFLDESEDWIAEVVERLSLEADRDPKAKKMRSIHQSRLNWL